LKNDWLEQVEKNIRDRKLFRKGESIVVAVSGGLDSMVLLRVLHAQKHDWKLLVAHFNHKLRGTQSDEDEQLVLQTARKLGLPFMTQSADVKEYATRNKLSIEMAARDLRHAFLADCARTFHSNAIALAHHADDQLELFFLRLLRGTGTQGLTGMRWIGTSPSDPAIRLVRPFLGQKKEDLDMFAYAEKIVFSEDRTNVSWDIPRNRIRHELIPLLKKHYQPALEKNILRLMDLVGAESDFINEMAGLRCRSARRCSSAALPAEGGHIPFKELPAALQRRSIQLQLFKLKLTVDFELVEQLRLSPEIPVSVGPQQAVVCDSKGQIHLRDSKSIPFGTACAKVLLPHGAGQGQIDFEGLRIDWSITQPNPAGLDKKSNQEQFNAEKVGRRIQLRFWQPGDRFHPIGAANECKLQDLFTNLKVPRTQRRKRVVAVAENGRIFWVEGLRMSEFFKLDKQCAYWLNWQWLEKGNL